MRTSSAVIIGTLLMLGSSTALAGTTSVTFPMVASTFQTLQTLTCPPGKATLKSSKKEGANGLEIVIKVKKIKGVPAPIQARVEVALAIGTAGMCQLYTTLATVDNGDLSLDLTGTDIGFPEQPEGTMVRPCNLIRLYQNGVGGNELLVSTLGAGSDPD